MSGGHVHGGPECVALFAKLSEFLDGELEQGACADVEGHLADCERCQEGNSVRVEAIEPYAMVEMFPDKDLNAVAAEASDRLRKAIEAI